jgi:hypothetical protein
MVESVLTLDRALEGQVARQKHVGPVERHEQEAARRPRSDTRNVGQCGLDLFVGHVREGFFAQASVDEPLGERPQRRALSSREAAVAQHLRIGGEQLGRRRQMPSESLLQVRDDRAGRADRELLAGDLEDERPEGVKRRKLVHPRPRPEIRPRVDQPREHRVRVPKELARLGIGNRGSLTDWSPHAHAFSSPSVSRAGHQGCTCAP